MEHPLLAEALARAAARRGWLDRSEIGRVSSALRGVAAEDLPATLRSLAPAMAERLADLLPPAGHAGFGRWRALARLGGGAMGAVWLAAADDGPLAVVKSAAVGRAPLLGGEAGGSVWTGNAAEAERASPDAELVQRFAREARITAGLVHPRIVPCLDGGLAADGSRYLVLAWVPDGDLAAELARGGPLRPAAALAVADQLADALDHAHARGVIHRDLKPANVFVHQDGAILLGDFGLARPTSAGATRLTMAGVAVGTPNAMAPEQIDGRDAIDGRADLYALGCLLFTCLAGRAPYLGRSAEVMHAHRTAPPPDLAALVPDLPAGLSALVARLMAKRPEDRPDAAAGVRAALAPLLVACGAQPGVPQPLRAAASELVADQDDALLLHGPDGDPTIVVWARRRIVLGKQRAPGIDLVVRDYPEEAHRDRIMRISRRHAAIAVAEDGTVTVEDLGSANGTTVDGRKLTGGNPLRCGPQVEVVLADVAPLAVRRIAGGVAIERRANRPGLRYVLCTGDLVLGAESEVPIPGAARQARLRHEASGWSCDGAPLSDRIDLDGFSLHAGPLGDFL